VKRIRNKHTIDEKLFYREVDSLLSTNHQNVVRFLGFCASTEQGAINIEGSRLHQYFDIRERLLCFEYISNGNLKNRITGIYVNVACEAVLIFSHLSSFLSFLSFKLVLTARDTLDTCQCCSIYYSVQLT
jgi:serine/threonine protein kinase